MIGDKKEISRQFFKNTVMIGWILIKLTLVSALLSPSVKEIVYAGF